MNKNIKKYLVSSLVTFISSFALAILPFVDQITEENLRLGFFISILMVGVRAGVKAVIEFLATIKL